MSCLAGLVLLALALWCVVRLEPHQKDAERQLAWSADLRAVPLRSLEDLVEIGAGSRVRVEGEACAEPPHHGPITGAPCALARAVITVDFGSSDREITRRTGSHLEVRQGEHRIQVPFWGAQKFFSPSGRDAGFELPEVYSADLRSAVPGELPIVGWREVRVGVGERLTAVGPLRSVERDAVTGRIVAVMGSADCRIGAPGPLPPDVDAAGWRSTTRGLGWWLLAWALLLSGARLLWSGCAALLR